MSLHLRRTVPEFLRQNPDQKFTSLEIAQWIFENFRKECEKKRDASSRINTDAELLTQIRGEITARSKSIQLDEYQVKWTEGRPRQYYWTHKSDLEEVIEAEEDDANQLAIDDQAKRKESDLYPVLSEYLWSEYRVYSKRIDERRSSNTRGSNGNKWLYPDVVAMEDLTSGWHDEIKGVVTEYSDRKTKLWSFEMKIRLNTSNVRESYFQAISNSSWANFGYLAAENVDARSMNELRMLYSLHGIGLIRVDARTPGESEVLIPARERPEVDWTTCNRLTKQNSNFLEYMKLVRQFHQTGDPRPQSWDYVEIAD